MRIIYLDIETSPLVCLAWGMWETNVAKLLQDFYILSVAYQWEGEKMQFIRSHKNGDDEQICKMMHKLFTHADVIVAQNGDKFDIKKINTRMAFHGLPPPPSYKTVDTLKILKQKFGLTRNSLDFVCKYFGFGGKIQHHGIDLWDNCMNNANHPDWAIMERYNKQDVVLLRKLYKKISPWNKNQIIASECPACKYSQGTWEGSRWRKGVQYRRRLCSGCGKRFVTDIKVQENDG